MSNNNNFNSISGLVWAVSFFDWHETKLKICTNVLVMTSVELYTLIYRLFNKSKEMIILIGEPAVV